MTLVGKAALTAALAERDAERAEALREAADNMPLNGPGQPYELAADWLRRRADAFDTAAALAATEDQP